jgi:predicted nucleotidyltransferase component of viral defense system
LTRPAGRNCSARPPTAWVSEAVVEKDLWVCWTLKQIFTIEQFNERLLFKGGTSLSKVFGAIQRFSEDIDLAVDYTLLGLWETAIRRNRDYPGHGN